MKKAALRYAEILEKGAWVTHQEQDEIAKLLRKLVTTEAWDTSDMAHRTGGLSIDLDADEWYEKALWGKKLEPLAVLKVWDEKEQKHVFMNYHLTPPNKPEQEPVAWVRDLTSPSTHCVTSLKYLSIADTDAGVKYIPLYTDPPSKSWIGLDNSDLQYQTPHDVITMRYAEALLKEKNT